MPLSMYLLEHKVKMVSKEEWSRLWEECKARDPRDFADMERCMDYKRKVLVQTRGMTTLEKFRWHCLQGRVPLRERDIRHCDEETEKARRELQPPQ